MHIDIRLVLAIENTGVTDSGISVVVDQPSNTFRPFSEDKAVQVTPWLWRCFFDLSNRV